METLRIGIIGFGNMGSAHAKHIFDGMVDGMVLTAVCDISDIRRQATKTAFGDGVAAFATHTQLLSSGLTDAVIIATPHYFHCPIAVDAFSFGQHVLSEKPAGVYTKQIEEMNRAATKSGKVFSVMFNQRTNSLFKKAREIVRSGEIGELKRTVWIITNWYRTQSYYDSGSWRATWSGEGGGVLLNQAPHNLDILQWICGMPKRIRGFCTVGKYHNIEVEDDATIYAEYENGATSVFITSTGEFPGTNRLEIGGTKGKIVIENGQLTFTKLKTDEREVCFNSNESFAEIPFSQEVCTSLGKDPAHHGILQNFCNAVRFGEPLISSGFEGINEVEISNAAYLSSWKNDWVELPVNGEEYFGELQKRIKQSEIATHTDSSENGNMDYSGRWSVRW